MGKLRGSDLQVRCLHQHENEMYVVEQVLLCFSTSYALSWLPGSPSGGGGERGGAGGVNRVGSKEMVQCRLLCQRGTSMLTRCGQSLYQSGITISTSRTAFSVVPNGTSCHCPSTPQRCTCISAGIRRKMTTSGLKVTWRPCGCPSLFH